MLELTKLMLALECPYCAAKPGEWCWSPKSGLKARYLHADRGRVVYVAWRLGYPDGIGDDMAMLATDLENQGHGQDWLKRRDVVGWLRGNAAANRG